MAETEVKTEITTATEPATTKVEVAPEAKGESEEIAKLKAALSRACSEAAEYKRQYKATLDEAKQKEMDAAEQRKKELEELEELRADRRVNRYKAKLMSAGVDETAADTMAKSLPDGVADAYFDSLKDTFERQKQAFEASAIKNQTGLSVGLPPAANPQKDEINKLRAYAGLPPLP